MLQEIHIQNYAVIDDLTVEFHPGLNLLSGETGSGKSIVVDALGLALGGRATTDLIRTGCNKATITAVFRTPEKAAWQEWLEEYGLESSDEQEIIFRRIIDSNGKSRLLVNDQPVTLGAVRALANQLVEVHGQNEQVSLFSSEAQLELLDRFAGVEELRRQVAGIYARRRQLEAEIDSLSQSEQDRLRTVDLLAFQLRELEQEALEPGEDVRLEEEKRVLIHLEKILSAASTAYGALYEDDNSACAKVASAARALDELGAYDAALESHLRPLEEVKAQLEDLALTLRDYIKDLQAQPHRLEELEDRLASIDRLKRKYGRTVEEVLAYQEQVRERLTGLEHSDERREELALELQQAANEYQKSAEQLSGKRRAAAERLEKLIRKELAELSMEKTRFVVYFAPLPPAGTERAKGGPRGLDEIELRLSPNPGEDLRPLEKIASGGELSRIMLALKTVLGANRLAPSAKAQRASDPTFVFDEVDAGIGGRVAERVGQRLKRLARGSQVLCVTHLAQIACFADHHFYVEKFERNGRSLTSVRRLPGEKERAGELARMLSGSQVTDAVLKHAVTILRQAAAETGSGAPPRKM
jgi:DNA repair protein RecN (Recombination protein N)